jgi:hypothetical protein
MRIILATQTAVGPCVNQFIQLHFYAGRPRQLSPSSFGTRTNLQCLQPYYALVL